MCIADEDKEQNAVPHQERAFFAETVDEMSEHISCEKIQNTVRRYQNGDMLGSDPMNLDQSVPGERDEDVPPAPGEESDDIVERVFPTEDECLSFPFGRLSLLRGGQHQDAPDRRDDRRQEEYAPESSHRDEFPGEMDLIASHVREYQIDQACPRQTGYGADGAQ